MNKFSNPKKRRLNAEDCETRIGFDPVVIGSTIAAKFEPKNTDDLQPGAEKFIGSVGIFQALWVIKEGDYSGEWAMLAPKE